MTGLYRWQDSIQGFKKHLKMSSEFSKIQFTQSKEMFTKQVAGVNTKIFDLSNARCVHKAALIIGTNISLKGNK